MRRLLLAFDLDGTLLDDDKGIPPENLRALEAAADRDFVLVPATGRMVPGIPANVRALPFCRYYIVSNGAGVFISPKFLIHDSHIFDLIVQR